MKKAKILKVILTCFVFVWIVLGISNIGFSHCGKCGDGHKEYNHSH